MRKYDRRDRQKRQAVHDAGKTQGGIGCGIFEFVIRHDGRNQAPDPELAGGRRSRAGDRRVLVGHQTD